MRSIVLPESNSDRTLTWLNRYKSRQDLGFIEICCPINEDKQLNEIMKTENLVAQNITIFRNNSELEMTENKAFHDWGTKNINSSRKSIQKTNCCKTWTSHHQINIIKREQNSELSAGFVYKFNCVMWLVALSIRQSIFHKYPIVQDQSYHSLLWGSDYLPSVLLCMQIPNPTPTDESQARSSWIFPAKQWVIVQELLSTAGHQD